MGDKVRVFLVDDHTLVRQGIAALTYGHDDIEIVGQCGTGADLLRQAPASRPDVIVLDISLPDINGVDLCRKITRRMKNTAVLILTMHVEDEYAVEALRSGAMGYLIKEAASDQLINAIRAVARGESYLGASISPQVLERVRQPGKTGPYAMLTPRQRQILQLIAKGNSNRRTAEILGISVKTVDTHRWKLMKALDIHDQASLIKYAIRNGLVGLE